VYHKRYGRWFVFRDEERRWVEVKKEEALHEIVEAAYEVRQDLEETIKLLHDGSIPKQYLKPLNRLINKQFLTNSVMTYIEANLSVDFDFPRIPDDIKASLPAEVTRITSHRNGVLLWLKNGDTVFLPCDRNNPEGDLHRRFYITYTIDSEVSETANMQPFLDKVAEWVGGRENAEFILKHLATVLGLKQNINNKFLLFIGDGRNGKNSFIQVLEAAFGKLVRYTTSEILTARRFDNNLNSTLSELSGCAFAVIDEAPDPSKWNVENVKRLTGSDKTQARRLYHDVEIVDITWLFIILTNEFPTQFKRQSQGLAHRIIAVNFPVTYSDNVINEGRFIKRRNPEEIEYFKQKTQIVIQAMRWAFKEAAKTNFVLTEPQQISQFTRPIKLKADSVSYFLSKYTVDDAHAEIPLQELYQAYCQFVKEEGIGSPLPDNIFAMRLYTKNIQHERRNGRTYIIGLRLKESALFEPASSLVGDNNGNGDGQAPEPADQDYLDQFPF
jgi:phage/plasmid-associated DNA primase